MKSAGGATLTRRPDGSILVRGKTLDADTCTIIARCPLPQIKALRLELETDAQFTRRGPFGVRASAGGRGRVFNPAPAEFTWVSDNRYDPSITVATLPNVTDGRVNGLRGNATVFFLREPIADPEGTLLKLEIEIPPAQPKNTSAMINNPYLKPKEEVAQDIFRLSAAPRTDLIAYHSLLVREGQNVWIKVAAAHCLCGDGEAALGALDRAVEHGYFKADEYRLLEAVALFQCKRREEGRKILGDVLSKLSSDNSVQWLAVVALSKQLEEESDLERRLLRARCYKRMGWWRPAVADYERAQELDPKDADILLECGECRLALGDAQGAAADFEAARLINRQAALDFHNRRVLKKMDLVTVLVHRDALAKATRGTPQERGWLLSLAELYARTEQYAESLTALGRLLELAPNDPEVLLLAASVHRKRAETSALLGKQEDARKDWREMRRLLEKRLALQPDSRYFAAELGQGLLAERARWTVVRPLEATANGGSALTLLPDGSVLALGGKTTEETCTLSAEVDWKGVRGVRMDFLGHPQLPGGGLGRGVGGNFSPPKVVLMVPRPVGLPASISLPIEPLAVGNLLYRAWWEWAVYPAPTFPDDARGKTSILLCPAESGNPANRFGRCRLSVTTDPQTLLVEEIQQSSIDGWLKLAAAYALNTEREAAINVPHKHEAERQPRNEVALAWIHLHIGKSDDARGAVVRVAVLAKEWKRGNSPFDDPLIRALTGGVFEKARAAWSDDKELGVLLREAEAAINGPKE
jgi:tetratricopeptide (TPR) repeat protein